MKKFLMIVMAGLIAVAAYAAGSGAGGITQADLAKQLVKSLGLASELPATASDAEVFALLMQNGIVPADGWDAEASVTKAVLARLLVQALGATDTVANPEDDASWLAALENQGISLDGPVAQTVTDLEAIPTVVAANLGRSSVDPMVSEATPSGAFTEFTLPFDVQGGNPPSAIAVVPVPPQTVAKAISSKKPHPKPSPTPH